MAAPTTTKRPRPSRPRGTAVVAYGLGDFANNLAFALTTTFGLFYLVDVAALPAVWVLVVVLVARLWQAIADLTAGRIVQRSGRLRPFLAYAGLPTMVLAALLFNVPAPGQKWLGLVAWDASDGVRLVYVLVVYAAFALAYSLVSVPYARLAPTMTRAPHERAQLVASRAFFSILGGLSVAYLLAPALEGVRRRMGQLDAATYGERLQSAFTTWLLLIVPLGAVCYWLTAAFGRQVVQPPATASPSLADIRSAVRANPALRSLATSAGLYLTGLTALSVSLAFFSSWVLGSIGHLPTMLLFHSGVSLVVTPFVPSLVKLAGRRTVFQFCGLLIVLTGFGLWFVPVAGRGADSVPAYVATLLLLGLNGIGASLVNNVMFALGPDTIEYGEWTTGRRDEAATYAALTLARRLAQALGAALVPAVLAIGGYVAGPDLFANGLAQDVTGLEAVRFVTGPLPAILAIAAIIAFMGYPVSEELLTEITEKNEDRAIARARAEAGAS